METRHLSDEEIQTDLNRPSGRKSPPVQRHLAQCPGCRNQWNAYRILFLELDRDISFRLSDERMAAILGHRPIPTRRPGITETFWIPALGLVLAVGTLAVINAWIPIPWEFPKFTFSLPRMSPPSGFNLQKPMAFLSTKGMGAVCLVLLAVGINECLRLRSWIRSLHRTS
jgi:hypothetical protein